MSRYLPFQGPGPRDQGHEAPAQPTPSTVEPDRGLNPQITRENSAVAPVLRHLRLLTGLTICASLSSSLESSPVATSDAHRRWNAEGDGGGTLSRRKAPGSIGSQRR